MRAPAVVRRSAALGLHGRQGTVRLRTSRCAYLGDAAALWAVVHHDTLALTPASIVLSSGLDDQAFLPLGAPVRLAWGRLHTPGVELVVAPAPSWQPGEPAPAPPPQPAALRRALAAAPVPVARGRADELAGRLAALGTALDAVGPVGSVGSVRSVRPDAAVGAALDRLVGFGPGLTPAGDDALVGLLAVAARWPAALGSPLAAARLRAAITRRLAHTTEYGAFYLRHALEGRFGHALLAVRDVLALGDGAPADELGPALRALLAVGATSGADLLDGLRVGFERTACDAASSGGARRSLAAVGVPS